MLYPSSHRIKSELKRYNLLVVIYKSVGSFQDLRVGHFPGALIRLTQIGW